MVVSGDVRESVGVLLFLYRPTFRYKNSFAKKSEKFRRYVLLVIDIVDTQIELNFFSNTNSDIMFTIRQ